MTAAHCATIVGQLAGMEARHVRAARREVGRVLHLEGCLQLGTRQIRVLSLLAGSIMVMSLYVAACVLPRQRRAG